jgi:CRISPR-associated protein Cmr6
MAEAIRASHRGIKVRKAIIDLVGDRGRGEHPGLILQKYLTQKSDQAERDHAEKRALIKAAVLASRNESLRVLYSEAFARWTKSFPQNVIYRTEQLSTIGRLAIGLGSESVLETGLRLHHTYGLPIIPGSALKGLASHYCSDVWGQRHADVPAEENRPFRPREPYHSLLFGTTEDGGAIAFHDALITPESLDRGALRLDVMTPHHPKWQNNEAAPTDFDSPNPVSFVSVSGTFDIRLSWVGPIDTPSDQSEAWTALAMKILCEALAEWGVGGKTSSGYGRLAASGTAANSKPPTPVVRTAPPASGTLVDAKLLAERSKSKTAGWRALHEPSGLSGPIVNTGDVPAEKNPGDLVRLKVHSVNQREISFRYPTPADEARANMPSNIVRKPNSPRTGGRR